jgi:Pyruvate/2-oxoacid:ferredoxin oxidoreductase delta subunit
MNRLQGANLRVVFYEGPGTKPAADRAATLAALLDAGFEVTRPAAGGEVAKPDGSPLLVLGRFEAGRAPAPADAVMVQDLDGLAPDQVVAKAREARERSGARRLEAWKPWFPVIDYERCTNCMQCLTFCLFDVYGVDKQQKIQVQNNDNCKTDCPACSRVCPEVAILFPKYKAGPINGDAVKQEDVKREAMKVDISALLGGDLYASLRTRQAESRKRFSTERDESKALLERKRCLKELGKQLDIPDEVLMSLPSVGDIQERAERAKAKMEQRLARSQTAKDAKPAPSDREWGI